jgi:hypothetical protein
MEPSGLVPRYNKNEWPTLTKKGGRIWLVFLQREKSPFLLENNRMVWGMRLTIFFGLPFEVCVKERIEKPF